MKTLDRITFNPEVIVIDMNLSPQWVLVLEAAGYEAIHWSTVGNSKATDKTIINWAVTNGYIVFTHDLDFGTLLAISQADAPSVSDFFQGRVQALNIVNIEGSNTSVPEPSSILGLILLGLGAATRWKKHQH